jgi:hypothetical protein
MTTFTTQNTTNSPQKHHVLQPVLLKNPSKTPQTHRQKKSAKMLFRAGVPANYFSLRGTFLARFGTAARPDLVDSPMKSDWID